MGIQGSPALPVALFWRKGYSVGFFHEPTGLLHARDAIQMLPCFVLLSINASPVLLCGALALCFHVCSRFDLSLNLRGTMDSAIGLCTWKFLLLSNNAMFSLTQSHGTASPF